MDQGETDKEPIPVEKRKIKGLVKHVVLVLPGLHEQWVTPRKFMYYVFPPSKLANGDYLPGTKDRWIESMSHLLDDIWWLCELQYHQFWSQIIFDSNSMDGIKSFLHLASLQQLYFKVDDQELLLLYKRIKKAVFHFMKRLLRIKESDLNFMSPDKYAEIMKKKNLVPAPLLFCLCTLYAKRELETVREMIAHVVQYNENLKLDSCVIRSIHLFSRMKAKLRKGYSDLKENMKHSGKADDVREAVNAYRQNLSSCVQFLANAALNISNFLHVYADGCEIFLIHDFDFHIIRAYKKLIIPASLEINVLYGDDRYAQGYARLISLLELTRLEFVKSFHVCLKALIDRLGKRLLAEETLQRIVQLMKMGLKAENFFLDCNDVRSLNDIHELMKKSCPNDIDLTVLNNVFESIDKELKVTSHEPEVKEYCIEDDQVYEYVRDDYDVESDDSTELKNNPETENGTFSSTDCSSEYSDWSKNENSDAEYEGYLEEDNSVDKLSQMNSEPVPSTSSAVSMSEMDLQTAISKVKEVLDHLGDGFIAMCLKAYQLDASAVINAVLENTLIPSLKEVDFTLPNIPSEILEEVKREYDSFPSTSKIETSGLKEFKRIEYSSYKDMYNDKSAVNQAKNIYEQYRNTEEDELYNDDVDEDYEEKLFAPPVETDAEGFYTEYANLPTSNPNHVCEDEEENLESRQEKQHQISQRPPNKNVRKSSPNRGSRRSKTSGGHENSSGVQDGDERRQWKKKGNRNRKLSDSCENRRNQDRGQTYASSEQNNRNGSDHDRRVNSRENFVENNREEEVTRSTYDQKPMDFCENPEITRARAEHRYRLKQERRRGTRQFYNSSSGKSATSQQEGRDDREQRDRHNKNVHKSSNANHSRRFFSDRKRRQD